MTLLRRRLASTALLPAALLLGLTVAGCETASGSDPVPATDQAVSGPEPATYPAAPEAPVLVTPYESIELHDLEGARLLAGTHPRSAGDSALAQGRLAVNEAGCFGFEREDSSFTAVVFPHGTDVAGPDAISYGGEMFTVGDQLALGGGMLDYEPPRASDESAAKQSLAASAMLICGFTDGAFAAWGEVELREDFERRME